MWDAQHIIGATAIFVAALATGSYAVPRKAEAVRRLQPPIENTIFIFYVCCGYAASTFLVCILLPFNQEIMDNYGVTSKLVFSWWGALSGALIVLAFNSGFVAISRLGLAMHSGISMGIAVVTSFLWGVLVNKDRLALLWVDVLAVVLLVTGSSLSAFHEELGTLTRSCRKDRKEECSSDSVEPVDIEESMPEARPLVGEHHATRRFRHFVGVCLSAISGACGGLSLGPMSFIPPAYKGIAFLPSFAAGISMAAATTITLRIACKARTPAWHFRTAVGWGLLSGFVYMIATVAVIIAIPRLSFAVAYPCKQCAILVSGLWGILYFKEMKGPSIVIFILGSSLILCGAILLSNFTFPERIGIPEMPHPSTA